MVGCVAYGCTNRSIKKVTGITFHKFPKDAARRAVWTEAVHRKNWTPTNASVLCSKHFTEDCFDRTSIAVVRLREHSVPSVFPAFPDYLQKKVQRLKKRHEIDFKNRREMEYQKRREGLEDTELCQKMDKCTDDPVAIKQEQLPPNLCRICAQHCDELVPIFGELASEEDLVTKIHTHLPIMVTADDLLPVNICNDCYKKLDVCHSLVQTCLSADATLRLMLGVPCEQDGTGFPTSDSSKNTIPVLPVTTVNNPAQPLLILTTPVVSQSAVLGTQSIFPSCLPPYLIVSQNGQLQMLGEVKDDVPSTKEVVVAPEQSLRKVNYCEICKVQFNGRKDYVQHKIDVQCTYKCSYCSRDFRNKSRKADHERSHSGERPYVCEMCGKAFRDASTLQRHADVHRNRTYACKECGKVYNNRSGLYWHAWTHRDATYLCTICGELVRRGSCTYAHRMKHSSTCRRCGHEFDNWELLKEHEKVTHKFCPLQCSCCVKSRRKNPQWSRHGASSCVDLWKCGFCTQSFATLGALNVHMTLKHKYSCFTCMQFFKDERELRVHKQMQCREVNSKDKDDDLHHRAGDCSRKESHRSVVLANKSKKYLVCDSCGEMFPHEQQYSRHKTNCASLHHFKCQTCGKVLKNKYRLLVHKQIHSHTERYCCSVCHRHFSFVNLLKKHRLLSHPVLSNSLLKLK